MELKGDSNGSQGAESYFLAKVVTMSDYGYENQFYDVEMSSSLNGKFTLGKRRLIFNFNSDLESNHDY